MAEITYTFPSMKSEHRRWEEDHRRWRAEIGEWQRQHAAALRDLDEIQELVRQHGLAIATIDRSIVDHERAMQSHLEAMSAFEQGEGGERRNEDLVRSHREHGERHRRQAEAQERIRRHHGAVLEDLTRLKEALLEAV